MDVTVTRGERSIEAAHRLLAEEPSGDVRVPDLGLDQIDHSGHGIA